MRSVEVAQSGPSAIFWLVQVLIVGAAQAATPFAKEYRNAGLYNGNTLVDLDGSTTLDMGQEKPTSSSSGLSGGFKSESSVVLPGMLQNSGCPLTTSSHCLRCNKAGCIKCPMYLVTDTRQCVDQCPAGYLDQWSAHTEFMGRVCVPTGYSGPLMAALAGLLGGFLVCLSLLAVAVMLVKRKRRRKSIKQKLINENTMDRADFMRQLNEMRPNAEYFLAMLNDTRRQIRKLYLSGEVAAANSYRPIVRDLAKLLILLNRPIELIPAPPPDWSRLYAWSEQALERYKPQVGQLIDFFQASHGHSAGHHEVLYAAPNKKKQLQQSSIFRQQVTPTATPQGVGELMAGDRSSSASAQQKLHLFGSLISLHEFEEPRASDPFGSSFNTLKSGNLISDLNASSLWLEDEFYKLGFRPQDEITTEL
uniref:T48 protein n=1 Tax=Drosophila melanogaster TaxID=7227 RepID=Q24548_DROME|nr:T48 [Drosophila melanogaster]